MNVLSYGFHMEFFSLKQPTNAFKRIKANVRTFS